MEIDPIYTSVAIPHIGVVSYLRCGKEVEMQVKNSMLEMRLNLKKRGVRASLERACEVECERHAKAFHALMEGLLASNLSEDGDDLNLQWSDTTSVSRAWELDGDTLLIKRKRYKTDVAFTLPREGFADMLIATTVLLNLNGTREKSLQLLYRHLEEQVEARRNTN